MTTRGLVLWVSIAGAAVYLVFFGGASNFLPSPPARILTQLVIVVAMLGGVLAIRAGAIDWRTPLLLPGLAYLGATAIASTASQRPAASLEALALLLLALPGYLVVRGIVWHPALARRIDLLVIAATTVFVAAYLVQVTFLWLSWWSVAGLGVPPLRPADAGLTIGTVNAVALYLELLVPIAAVLAWRRWHRRWVVAGLLAAGGLALLITASRGAWLGTFAGMLLLGLLVWLDRGRPRPRALSASPRARVATVAVLVGGIVVAIVVGPVLVTRLLGGDAGRLELWSAAWSMIVSSPVTGVGPGAWQGLRPLTPISEANLAVLYTTHNSLLQFLVEGGLLLLGAVVWIGIAIVRATRATLRGMTDRDDRMVVLVAVATLVAVALHSLVDIQWHIPAIVVLTFHLVARADRPAPVPAGTRVPRLVVVTAAAAVLAGAAILLPIDWAMLRAQSGNAALDAGDAATADAAYRDAIALHDLPIYRLGQALARDALGDASAAAESLDRMAALEQFDFVTVQRALAHGRDLGQIEGINASGAYDPTASVNAAAMLAATDPDRATRLLASAMVDVPTLIPSTPPADVFDPAMWAEAQRLALAELAELDPVVAAGLAILAARPDETAAARDRVEPGSAEARALDLLAAATAPGGSPDLPAARALLRDAPTSGGVQAIVWFLAFQAESQPDIDTVATLSRVQFFGTPTPPMELVTDGLRRAEWSARLPRYPMAASSRLGPDRPYLEGMITIEPVYRPER